MKINPFKQEKAVSVYETFKDWNELNQKPYNKKNGIALHENKGYIVKRC